MRWVTAVLILLHGFAHLVGVAGSWDLLPHEQRAYRTTILRGRLDLGTRGMQFWGFLWGSFAIILVGIGVAGVLAEPWWVQAAITTIVASLLLTLAELPDARFGVFINLALLALLLAGRAFNWF